MIEKNSKRFVLRGDHRQLDSGGWAAITSPQLKMVASMASKNSLKSTLEYGAFLKWGYFQIIHAFSMK
jgi:hypothetical protein